MLVKKLLLLPYICALLFVTCLSVSCGSDDDPVVAPDPTIENPDDGGGSETHASAEIVEMHKWMLQQMKAKYLWQEDIPSNVTTDTENSEAFFKTMLSQNDGKHNDNYDYFYSYLEKDPEYISTRALQSGDTYGMQLTWYRLTVNGTATGNFAARVLYVCDGSSAAEAVVKVVDEAGVEHVEKAGIERGDWIWYIDKSGKKDDISSDELMSLVSGSGLTLYITRDGEESSNVNLKLATLAASKEMNLSPVFRTAVVEQGSKKIGYICYNAFVSGVTSFETFEYDDELIESFESFESQNIDELVLDLRYNGGGSLNTAGMLAYMIAPSSSLSDPIWILTEHDGNKRTHYMSSFTKRYKNGANENLDLPNLNLSNLYCLVSENTASASEAVANGLKEYMNVTLIGTTTEGKDVGMDRVRDSENKYPYYMWPITFRITSTDTSFHYSDGLVPDTDNILDEKFVKNADLSTDDIEMFPLGDPQEALFARALELITGTKATRAAKGIRTYRSVGVEVPEYCTIKNKPWYKKNALMIPTEDTTEKN